MSAKFFILFVVVIIGFIISIEAQRSLRTIRSARRSKDRYIKKRNIRQFLDNFDNNDHRMWDQRFFSSDKYYETGGPIFLMLLGESSASHHLMEKGSWITWAKKYGAMLLLLEHRFYGNSFPTPNLSVDNLKYLTSKQALADTARFIKTIKKVFNYTSDQPWILFGGSYAGALAIWMAELYPDLVDGVVSSSAPLKFEVNFFQFLDSVSQSLSDYSVKCSKEIYSGFKALREYCNTVEGQYKLYDMFRLCQSIVYGSDKDLAGFFHAISGSFVEAVQFNTNSYKAGTFSIEQVCKVMTDEYNGSSLERLAKVNKMVLATQSTCVNFKYDVQIKQLSEISIESPAVKSGVRQWTYQTCNEFGYFQTTDGPFEIFGNDFSLDYFISRCKDVFGEQFGEHHLENKATENKKYYGGLHPNVSNVLAVQGSGDPWHTVGYTKNTTEGITALFIDGTSHCADTYSSSDTDPPQLTEARKQIEHFIDDLLNY